MARCIDKENGEKAMAVIEVLFNSQDKWAVRNPIPPLQQIGKQAGLSQQAFDDCLKDQTLYNNVLAMRERATHPERIRLLWDVAQVPDFRKLTPEMHARLMTQVFEHLTAKDAVEDHSSFAIWLGNPVELKLHTLPHGRGGRLPSGVSA